MDGHRSLDLRGNNPYPHSGLQILAIFIVIWFTVSSSVVCGLRIYGRLISKSFWLDDWLICVATAISIAQCCIAVLFIRHGYIGVHNYDIPAHDSSKAMFYNFIYQVLYNPILSLVKISLLIFLLRLGGATRRNVRIAIITLMVFILMQLIVHFCTTVFQCSPVPVAWAPNHGEGQGTCTHQGAVAITGAALNIFTDVLVLALPFWIFLDIKMNKRVRNALIAVFMLGICVTAISILRLYCLWKVFFGADTDRSYSVGYTTSHIETNLAIMTASAPSLWPLARRWFPSLDDKLGINVPNIPDIEVQWVVASRRSSAAPSKIVKPPRVKTKVTWTFQREMQMQPSMEIRGRNPEQGGLGMGMGMDGGRGAGEGQRSLNSLVEFQRQKMQLDGNRRHDRHGCFSPRESMADDSYHAVLREAEARRGRKSGRPREMMDGDDESTTGNSITWSERGDDRGMRTGFWSL